MRSIQHLAPLAAILAVSGVVSAVAFGSAPSGQSATVLSNGHLAASGMINTERIMLQTKAPTDVTHFTVTYAVGGFSGWHTHPGLIIATVRSGKVIREVGCDAPIVYAAGDTFIESGEQPSGQVSNFYASAGAPGAEPAIVDAAQLVPRGSARREDQPGAPSC
jgi:quercetin dioxygenase-like cupin family protein